MVMPVGPLMTEHRVIERMINVMNKGKEQIEREILKKSGQSAGARFPSSVG